MCFICSTYNIRYRAQLDSFLLMFRCLLKVRERSLCTPTIHPKHLPMTYASFTSRKRLPVNII